MNPHLNSTYRKSADLLRTANSLSLDVTLGSGIAFGFVHVILGQPLQGNQMLALMVAVWCAYTADHLLDSIRLVEGACMHRHSLHRSHFAVLAGIVLVLALLMSIFLIAWKQWSLLVFGLLLGSLTSVYLYIVFRWGRSAGFWLQKEGAVAGIYTLGIWGFPIWQSGFSLEPATWLTMIVFFLVVWADILVIALHEREQDEIQGNVSFIRQIGSERALRWIRLLLLSATLGSVSLSFFSSSGWPVAGVYLLMIGAVWLLSCQLPCLTRGERYRWFAEVVMFVPILIML